MNEVQVINKGEVVEAPSMTISNRLEIIEEGLRKSYLSRLTEMRIAPTGELIPLEEDLIDNVRLYYIDEMVYKKGEPVTDKFTTVFNTLSTYNASVFIIMDSDGFKTDFYIGVRNNEFDDELKYKLFRTVKEILHPTIIIRTDTDRSRKTVSEDFYFILLTS